MMIPTAKETWTQRDKVQTQAVPSYFRGCSSELVVSGPQNFSCYSFDTWISSYLLKICTYTPWYYTNIQSEERQVGHANVNLDIDIFVISEQKWLKFGLQAHLFKVFGYAKFQLSIFFTLRVMKLLVEIFSNIHKKFDNFESRSDRELKFGMLKHLEKMCLETKFQPFRFRNDKDIDIQIDVRVSNLTFLRL